MLNTMNAVQVIREIDALSAEERSKVMAHLQRPKYLRNRLEEIVPNNESLRQLRIEELNHAFAALSDEAKANGLTEELLNDILNEVNPS